jgi:hypothetical protein
MIMAFKSHIARIALLLALFLCSCNSPPHYALRAEAYLKMKNVSQSVITRLTQRQALTKNEVEMLVQFDYIPVLHLVGANPGTPVAILEQLAKHHHFEVRTGIAANQHAPLDLLLPLRTMGEYTTVNRALASNSRIPQIVLWEMYRNHEAGLTSFASNENCPQELMREIASKGNWLDRQCLARNPSLPPDLFERLKDDPNKLVRANLAMNPSLPPPLFEKMKNDPEKMVQNYLRGNPSYKHGF